jgi:hypothetical protein
VRHNFGNVEATLAKWMEIGPGPRRYTRPIAARSRLTREPLPLTVIPMAYRNDDESRRLIAEGKIQSPWPERPESSM